MPEVIQLNPAADVAVRFIEGFNNDDWDAVRDVVAPGFVFHHPVGGTVRAGPEGMVSTWAGFKQLSPDSWHPIPILIVEGAHVATLLPTFGSFTGQGEHSPPPTGGRLDYGMVNIARVQDDQIAEIWFGMDSLVEMQQLGVAPAASPRELSDMARANVRRFDRDGAAERGLDTVVGFDDVVVATGPRQADKATTTRWVEVHAMGGDDPTLIYRHEIQTSPPYSGDPTVDTDESRGLIQKWASTVLCDHGIDEVGELVTPNVLVHPTAMPCEATFHGPDGVRAWLREQWDAFPDLVVMNEATVAAGDIVAARWAARGTSKGPFLGLDPTGSVVEFTGSTMYRTEAGRIAEIWDARNTLSIVGQLSPELVGAGHHHH